MFCHFELTRYNFSSFHGIGSVYTEFVGSQPGLQVCQYFHYKYLHIPLVKVTTHEHIQNTVFECSFNRLNLTIIRVNFYKSRQTQIISIFIFKFYLPNNFTPFFCSIFLSISSEIRSFLITVFLFEILYLYLFCLV